MQSYESVDYMVTWTEKVKPASISNVKKGCLINSTGPSFVATSVMTQQPRQLWLSTTACLCLLFLPLTSVGTGLCRGLTSVDWQKNGVRNYRQGGTDTSSLHTSVCECWVACADATHASAVSSHWLIPLPRSPCDSEFLSWLLWSHMFSMAEGGRVEAPVRMVATSSLWHNRKTHTSAWRHSAPASNWAPTFQEPGNTQRRYFSEIINADPPPSRNKNQNEYCHGNVMLKKSSSFTELHLLHLLVNESGWLSGGSLTSAA